MLVITHSNACEERHVSLKLSTGTGERTVASLTKTTELPLSSLVHDA